MMKTSSSRLSSSPSSSSAQTKLSPQNSENNSPPNYESWTHEQLIERLNHLESAVSRSPLVTLPRTQGGSRTASKATPTKKPFDFSSYNTQKIALKFCYSGSEYGGLAYQTGPTPFPTVESVLWDALVKARFVDGDVREGDVEGGTEGFERCGWEKCGRTDRGVSAAGQVVSLWVRMASKKDVGGERTQAKMGDASATPETKGDIAQTSTKTPIEDDLDDVSSGFPSTFLSETERPSNTSISRTTSHSRSSGKPSPPQERELNYLTTLNKLLPPTIRILAWSPVSPTFSARFNCRHRHYKYFFSSYNPGSAGTRTLDIPAMRDAANLLVGEHDFRNLCKIDPSKQITNYKRTVITATIKRVSGDSEGAEDEEMYVLDLVGTAFLYHQVRHIMAILLLVGSGLEKPDVVSALLNVSPASSSSPLPVVDTKPEYQMADALPLVLWDCVYDEKDVQWRTSSGLIQPSTSSASASASSSITPSPPTASAGDPYLHTQVRSIWQRSRIHTTLDHHFLSAVEKFHSPEIFKSSPYLCPPPSPPEDSNSSPTSSTALISTRREPSVFCYPLGGGAYKRTSEYVPLLQRKRGESVEVVNRRWMYGKGARKGFTFKGKEDGERNVGGE